MKNGAVVKWGRKKYSTNWKSSIMLDSSTVSYGPLANAAAFQRQLWPDWWVHGERNVLRWIAQKRRPRRRLIKAFRGESHQPSQRKWSSVDGLLSFSTPISERPPFNDSNMLPLYHCWLSLDSIANLYVFPLWNEHGTIKSRGDDSRRCRGPS